MSLPSRNISSSDVSNETPLLQYSNGYCAGFSPDFLAPSPRSGGKDDILLDVCLVRYQFTLFPLFRQTLFTLNSAESQLGVNKIGISYRITVRAALSTRFLLSP